MNNDLNEKVSAKYWLRKMYSEHGADIGIENGQKIGARDCGTSKTKTEKLYHKVKKKD